MYQFLESTEDLQWLKETHLTKVIGELPDFVCATLYGNEDCPTAIHLYKQNDMNSRPLVLNLSESGDKYWIIRMGDFV